MLDVDAINDWNSYGSKRGGKMESGTFSSYDCFFFRSMSSDDNFSGSKFRLEFSSMQRSTDWVEFSLP